MRDDPELDIIRKRGFEHERRFLADLRSDGRQAVTIELDASIEDRGDQLRAAAAATIEAMAAGSDVIFQATFFDGTWRGHADFLLRVDDPARPSTWGPFHYEVADTKLARHVKASAVLQICSYIDQLERLQGVAPEWLHVALGGSARTVERLRVDDYMAYYRSARDRFLAAMADDATVAFPPPGTYPEPVDHCDVCRWAAECVTRRKEDDHLSLVAGISARQRRALSERGVTTLEALGDLPLPVTPKLEGTSIAALTRVREQARLQLEGRREARLKYELLLPPPGEPVEPERGLASLPEPSSGDLFFDIEGDPFALDDGLDYLFGVLEVGGDFHAFWSRDASGAFTLDGERAAFERFIDFVMARLEADPTLHVYHYAPYEPTALKRLMGRYGTREAEVDRLLREGVLVDLLRAVRQSLRASVDSYSIKRMEGFYGFTREINLRDAGSSIVAFETWLQLGEGERPAATQLDDIERYNHDDVVSNRLLRDWLEGLRDELTDPDRSARAAPGSARHAAARGCDRESGAGAGPGGATGRSGRRRRRDGAHARAARPLAARPAHRLASARGEVDVVGVPSTRGPRPGGPRGRECGDRAADADRVDRCRAQGPPDLALRLPVPGFRSRARRCLRPRQAPGRPRGIAVRLEGRHGRGRGPGPAHDRPEADGDRRPSPGARAARLGAHDRPPGLALRARCVGRRARHRRARSAPGRTRPVDEPSSARRAGRRHRPPATPARPTSRRPVGSACSWTRPSSRSRGRPARARRTPAPG